MLHWKECPLHTSAFLNIEIRYPYGLTQTKGKIAKELYPGE